MRLNMSAICLAALPLAFAGAPAPAAAPRTLLALRYKGLVSSTPLSAAFVMPGETLTVAVPSDVGEVRFEAAAGSLTATAAHAWRWTAPSAPGMYRLRAVSADLLDTVTLHAFVMVPAAAVHDGYLNGYRIGRYPAAALRGLAAYRPPRGFIEVTPQNENVYLTPHLQLGQFVAKQGGRFPKYVVLDERLLVKLEELLDQVHRAGYDVQRFRIMSGYRTPYYNHAIGNVAYSRHVYGAAADILVDDLNRDGRIDRRDAAVLAAVVERRVEDPAHPASLGGIGEYARTATHGPFVHVDVRGFRARW